MLGIYILALSVAACAVVGSLVVARGLRDPKVAIYGLLTLTFVVLCVMNTLAISMKTDQLFYVRGVMGSTTLSMYLIYLLIKRLKPRENYKPIYKTKLFYATLVIFFLDFTDFLFTGVIPGEPPTPIPNLGVVFFFGHFIIALCMAIWILRSDMMQVQSADERRRYQFLIAGIIPIVALAPLTSFILPNIFGINQFVIASPLYVFIFTILVGYAIVRHGLFDIHLAAVRTVVYILSLLTLSGAYYAMAYLVSIAFFRGQTTAEVSVSPVNILLAIGLSFVFQPIKRFFDRLTNNIFYRDRYDSDEFFARLSSLLTSTIDLRGLIERAADELATTFKAEQAFFFLYYTNGTHHHLSAGTEHHSRLPVQDARMLDVYIGSGRGDLGDIVVTELLPENSPIRRMLVSHNIALVMPLQRSREVVGYVCLGEQQGRGYSKRDLKVLATTADELVIAIQNALSLHEIKQINATLQQSIDNATKELRSSNAQLRHLDEVKDEFMSMASHQLRTPLTSVKGYISMVLEGDAGKITPQQTHLLTEAFNSSERMVRLIADFLNVSRLQTGKFIIEKSTIDLAKVVKGEVDNLQVIAASHDMKLEYKAPKTIPAMAADEAKIRQVIMNFVDNAIYYSRPNSVIKVTLEKIDDQVSFTVTDTGIGVPLEEQGRLFGKFFRAKNARKQRPDGTGVGLFLAKKVVTAHGGKMVFNSVEDKGSTFGFRIPIRQS